MRKLHQHFFVLTACGILWSLASGAIAQRVQVEAVAGSPFGVGRVIVPATAETPGDPWADGRIDVLERSGRVFYPALTDGPIRQIFRSLVGVRRNIVIHFLFTGNQALDLTVNAPDAVQLKVIPRNVPDGRRRGLLMSWWREYSRSAQRHAASGDYPTVIDNYLTSMLARRLSLQPPNLQRRGLLTPPSDDGMELLLGTERMLGKIQRRDLLKTATSSSLLRQPPAEPAWPEVRYPAVKGEIVIEPMAHAVPENFFYLRCGTYANYVWMQTVMDEWGELRNMITERGVDHGIDAKIERLLGLEDTVLSRKFGAAIISDVAFVGADPFLEEGPSFGMLFEASNNFLVTQSLLKQRNDALAKEGDGATEAKVVIDGRKVSFASSPDGGLRSYYSMAGNYHLVTTSKTMMREFLAVGKAKGEGSIGQSDGFAYARSIMPLDRNDTLMLYTSDAFFRRLASPQYRIEMARRLRSIAEMQSIRLAKLAAAAEGRPGETIDDLVASDMLPRGFGRRADGSQINIGKDGSMTDSLRGKLGLFVPIADVPVNEVSRDEAAEYAEFVNAYRSSPSRMDPMIVGIKRVPTETPGLESIAIDAHVAPLRATQFQRISSVLGSATTVRMSPLAGELLRVEGIGPQNNHIFLGVQDFRPPLTVAGGKVQWGLPNYETLRAYLGGAPSLGIVESLLSLISGRPAGARVIGYTQLPLGLWQWSDTEKTLLSFKREVIDFVAPQLRFVETGRPAQVRIDVDDLSQREVAWAINAYGYEHARNVSIGNTAFLQSLTRQLHTPRAEALKIAEELVGAKLVCALHGKYQQEADNNTGFWVSTAWSGANRDALTEIPTDYVFPVLQWFRGMTGELVARPNIMSIHAELLMQRKPPKKGFAWPDFFQSTDPKPKDAAPALPEVDLPKLELPKVDLPEPEELPPPRPKPKKN
jgi:hypothetical protein